MGSFRGSKISSSDFGAGVSSFNTSSSDFAAPGDAAGSGDSVKSSSSDFAGATVAVGEDVGLGCAFTLTANPAETKANPTSALRKKESFELIVIERRFSNSLWLLFLIFPELSARPSRGRGKA